jgi:hypothetical protein
MIPIEITGDEARDAAHDAPPDGCRPFSISAFCVLSRLNSLYLKQSAHTDEIDTLVAWLVLSSPPDRARALSQLEPAYVEIMALESADAAGITHATLEHVASYVTRAVCAFRASQPISRGDNDSKNAHGRPGASI